MYIKYFDELNTKKQILPCNFPLAIRLVATSLIEVCVLEFSFDDFSEDIIQALINFI